MSADPAAVGHDPTNLEAALTELVIGNDDFEEIGRALEVFCPFEAIGVVRQEIKHAHFLSYVLDPQRPHDFGSEALRAFIAAVTRAVHEQGGTLSPLDVHLMSLDGAEVRREWRSIDMLIVVPEPKLALAIELKIDAREHRDQLSRYLVTVGEEFPVGDGWQHLFLFLTKRGETASEDSGEGWLAVGLQEVASGLSTLAAKQAGSPEARMMLQAYIGMLRRHHLGDERLERLAAQLWAQHGEALAFLADRRPDILGKVFDGLTGDRERLAVELSQRTGLSIVPDHSTTSFLRFGVASWDDLPGMLSGTGWTASNRLLLLEIEKRPGTRSITARFELGPGDVEARGAIFNALKEAGADVGGTWALSDKWRQLANKVIFRAKDDDVRAVDDVSEATRAALMKFAELHLQTYNRVISGR